MITQKELRLELLTIIPFRQSSEEYTGSAAILERYVISRSQSDELPSDSLMRSRLELLKRVYKSNHSPHEAVTWAKAAEEYADAGDTAEFLRATTPAPAGKKSAVKAAAVREL